MQKKRMTPEQIEQLAKARARISAMPDATNGPELLTTAQIVERYKTTKDGDELRRLFAIFPYAEEIQRLRESLAEIAKSDYTRAATNCAAWKAVEIATKALNPDRAAEKAEMARLEAADIRRASKDAD